MSLVAWLSLVLWLYVSLFLLWVLRWWLARHIYGLSLLLLHQPRRAELLFHVLLAPGVAVHELSHWAMAKLLLVPTGRVSLFRPTRLDGADRVRLGYVQIARTDVWRTSAVGVAPLLGGAVIVLLLGERLGASAQAGFLSGAGLTGLPVALWRASADPVALLLLYLVFSIGNGMLPSEDDRRPWLAALALPTLVAGGAYLAGLRVVLPPDLANSLFVAADSLVWAFFLIVIVDLLLLGALLAAESLVGRLRRRRVEYGYLANGQGG